MTTPHTEHEPRSFRTKYVFSTNHKVIGLQFTFLSLLFVIVGGLLALGVRSELAWPKQHTPHSRLLPGGALPKGVEGPRMTIEAFEANVALWEVGGQVQVTRSLNLNTARLDVKTRAIESIQHVESPAPDARTQQIEAHPTATLMGFEDGLLGVAVPPGTRVLTAAGEAWTVQSPVDARVPLAQVVPDYRYKEPRPQVRAVPGKKVQQLLGDGPNATTRDLWLVGTSVHRPGPGGQTQAKEAGGPVYLTVVPQRTRLSIQMPDQAPTVDGVAVVHDAATVTITGAGARAVARHHARANRGRQQPVPFQVGAATRYPFDVRVHGEKVAVETRATIKELDGGPRPTRLVLEVPAGRVELNGVPVPVAGMTGDVLASELRYTKQTLTDQAYLQLFSMHATIMIFFVIIPMLVGGFGNFLVPLMIGARDMAFPRINMLSIWIAAPAGVLLLASFFTSGGAAGGGWTMYPTLSEATYSTQVGTTLWIISVGLVGFSSVVGALNYITTIINMRAPGMGLFRMPLTVWSILITSLLALFATPVLTAAMVMLLFDRLLGTVFFQPTVVQTVTQVVDGITQTRDVVTPAGGQPLLFQHLFWFYSHPAVYIMILPAMGVTSDVLSVFARKPVFGYRPMVYAMAGITGLGFIVWGHHMFHSGMNPILGTTFMASTIMIALPSAIKIFNWLGTLWGGDIHFTPAMLNAIAFVSMFVIGGLSGIFMASPAVDVQIHDTYFIVAHIHYVLFGGSIFGIFAGIYHWFPKMFGRQLNQRWGVIHFVLTFIGFNGTFFVMHILGIGGHARRYAAILEYPQFTHLQPLNIFMTLCALMLGMAQIPFLYNVMASLPRKLGRAIAAVFAVGLVCPTVAGTSYWIGADGNYGPAWGTAGGVALLAALVALNVAWLRALPRGGKITTVLLDLILLIFVVPPMLSGMRGSALPATAQLIHDVSIAVGHGVVTAALIAAAVVVVWSIGGRLRMPALLQSLLYVLALPGFVAPIVLSREPYMWINQPALWDHRWLILALLSVPGLLHLIFVRPVDAFGHEAGANPWRANSLEWCTTSPPPHTNFDRIPTVYRGPYEYSSPVVNEDYLPQDRQLPASVAEPTH